MEKKCWAVVVPERWLIGRVGEQRHLYTRWHVLKRYVRISNAEKYAQRRQTEGVMACVVPESDLLQTPDGQEEVRTFERSPHITLQVRRG